MSSHGDNLDRFNSLPEELIPYILSLMPTKYAVQTCILSKRWRYSWTFIHNLDLDEFNHGNSFSKFVDQALELFKPFQVKKIRLRVLSFSIPKSVMLKWISKAVTFNVSELDIQISDVELPLSLFTCKTLTKFRLHYSYPQFSLPDCVSSINLPNLKTLDIYVACGPIYDVVKLIHCCPLLTKFRLHYSYPQFSLPDCLSSINLPNLKTLDIYVAGGPIYDVVKLIHCCPLLTKFRLHYSYPEFSLPDCVSSINLPNLKTLDIYVAGRPIYDVVKLIHCCPILINLSLKLKWLDEKEDCTFNIPTLKRLKLSIFSSSVRIKKVILNVPNLECIIVDGVWCSRLVIEDLSSLVEANVSCKVVHEYLWFELLKVISEAKFLSITTKYWMSLNDQSQWPKFPNLKRLDLQGCAKVGRRWKLIPQFLEHCPMLQFFSVEKPNAGVWVEPLSIPTCMPMILKTMRYSKSKGDMSDIQFLRFILSNSKALKTLTVECDATLSSKDEKQWLAELSTLNRGSRDRQIHFVGKLSLKNK